MKIIVGEYQLVSDKSHVRILVVDALGPLPILGLVGPSVERQHETIMRWTADGKPQMPGFEIEDIEPQQQHINNLAKALVETTVLFKVALLGVENASVRAIAREQFAMNIAIAKEALKTV